MIAWGWNRYGQCDVPALPVGLAYRAIAAASHGVFASVGAASSYVTFGGGCAGSLPPSRLVPRDTPRIGATLEVRLANLPANAAFLIAGTSTTTSTLGPLPLDLGALGMPGCSLRVSNDFVRFLVGSGGSASHALAIPNSLALVGARFYQQALVLDPAAGNVLGAVVSDAAAAVIGN
jgi:hypothetical protein